MFSSNLANSAIWVDETVEPPIKIFGDKPGYTEEARMQRIQGVVILRGIIDAEGPSRFWMRRHADDGDIPDSLRQRAATASHLLSQYAKAVRRARADLGADKVHAMDLRWELEAPIRPSTFSGACRHALARATELLDHCEGELRRLRLLRAAKAKK